MFKFDLSRWNLHFKSSKQRLIFHKLKKKSNTCHRDWLKSCQYLDSTLPVYSLILLFSPQSNFAKFQLDGPQARACVLMVNDSRFVECLKLSLFKFVRKFHTFGVKRKYFKTVGLYYKVHIKLKITNLIKSEIVSIPTNLCWSEFHSGAALRPKIRLTLEHNHIFPYHLQPAQKRLF